MQFIIWGLVSVYALLAVALLFGLLVDGQAFTPGPSKESNAGWYLACAVLMLVISMLWPIALALDAYWGEMEEG